MLASVAATLRLGDAVKFAKYLPPAGETEQSIHNAIKLVEWFKQQPPAKALETKGEQL